MAFRDKQKADQYRIQALEQEAAAKDAQIAQLEARLTQKKSPKPPLKPRGKQAEQRRRRGVTLAMGIAVAALGVGVAIPVHGP